MSDLPPLPWDEVNRRDSEHVLKFLGVQPAGTEPRKYPCIQCASHDALHAYPERDGSALLKCFSCGRSWSNVDAVMHVQRVDEAKACKILARYFGIHFEEDMETRRAEARKYVFPDPPEPSPRAPANARPVQNDGRIPRYGDPVKRYNYPGPDGVTLHAVLRYESETEGKTFRQVHRKEKGGDWFWGQMAPYLYRLAEVEKGIEEESVIWLVEGEKDADRLAAEGLVATTWAGGAWSTKEDGTAQAPKWKEHHTEQLLDAHQVAILTDHDVPGIVTAEAILDALDLAGIDARWVRLDPDDMGPVLKSKGKDVSDWLDAGHDVSELDDLFQAAKRLQDAGWNDPEPLIVTSGPPLPYHLLPEDWVAYLLDLASVTQTPIGLPFMASLGTVSASVAKKAELTVRKGWTEPLNLYTAAVARPGERKSAVMSAAAAPVRSYELDLIERTKPDRAKAYAKQRYLKRAADKALDAAAKKPGDKELEQVYLNAQEALDLFEIPAEPRLVVSDATPERTTQLMEQNHGRIAVLDPEADPLTGLASMRYSSGSAKGMNASLSMLKKSWSNEDLIVDRMNRDNTTVRGAALTMALSVQPSVLQALGQEKQLFGEGLLARILYAVPESYVGDRKTGEGAPEPSLAIRIRYSDIITAMLASKPAKGAVDKPEPWTPHHLTLGTEARTMFYQFEAEVEDELGVTDDMVYRDWLAKLCGNTARVAALIHLFDTTAETGGPWNRPSVSGKAMEAALAIAKSIMAHSRLAFDLMLDGEPQGPAPLRYLLRRVVLLADDRGRVKPSAIQRSTRRKKGFGSAEKTYAHLAKLEEMGWVRLVGFGKNARVAERAVVVLHPKLVGTRTDRPVGMSLGTNPGW